MARHGFSLQTYLTLARNRAAGAPPYAPVGERPPGPLIWVQNGDRARSATLATLLARVQQQRPEINVLKTGTWHPDDAEPLPQETLSDARLFLDSWRPDLCLWSDRNLRPALLSAAAESRVPLFLADPGGAPFTTDAPRWLPDAVPATLDLFHTVFVPDAEAERRLPRSALPLSRLRRIGPLSETTVPLDVDETQHDEVMTIIAGRPVWLAARTRGHEAAQVLEAHRRATRYAHRLLLVLVPGDPEDAATAAEAAEASDLRLCRWDEGETLDESTQVLLCAGPEDLGLWYRIAPLAFLGGSLVPGHGGMDPFEAAALGTAILYGPNVGGHLSAYSRLVETGAARIVRDIDTLAGAVSQLVAPDRAAAMAHAGWDVVTRGASATDAVIGPMLDALDDAHSAPAES